MAPLKSPRIWHREQQQVQFIAQSSVPAWPRVQSTMFSVLERLFLATEGAHEGPTVLGPAQGDPVLAAEEEDVGEAQADMHKHEANSKAAVFSLT